MKEYQFLERSAQMKGAFLRFAGKICGESNAPLLVAEALKWARSHCAEFDNAQDQPAFFRWTLNFVRAACESFLLDVTEAPELLLPPDSFLEMLATCADDSSCDDKRQQVLSLIERANLTTRQERCLRMLLTLKPNRLPHTLEEIGSHFGIWHTTVKSHIDLAIPKLIAAYNAESEDTLDTDWFAFVAAKPHYAPKDVWDDESAEEVQSHRLRDTVTDESGEVLGYLRISVGVSTPAAEWEAIERMRIKKLYRDTVKQ